MATLIKLKLSIRVLPLNEMPNRLINKSVCKNLADLLKLKFGRKETAV
jgi:hypothetical protein